MSINLSTLYIGTDGDSFARWNSTKQASPYYRRTQALGFISALNMISGNRYQVALDWNKGVGGETTAQILARLSAWASSPCNLVVLTGGRNDIVAGASVSTILANRASMRNQLVGYGLTVIDMNLTPCGWDGTGWTPLQIAAANQKILDVNAGLATTIYGPNIFGLDAFSIIDGVAGTLIDNLHYSQLGGALIGHALAHLLQPYYGRSEFNLSPKNVLAGTRPEEVITASREVLYKGSIASGTTAYYEVELEILNTSDPAWTGLYVELLSDSKTEAQGHVPLPPPGVTPIASPFAADVFHYCDKLVLRTPVASGLNTTSLRGRVVIEGSNASVRVCREQMVVG